MNSTALKENNPEQLKKVELSGVHAYYIKGNDERLFLNGSFTELANLSVGHRPATVDRSQKMFEPDDMNYVMDSLGRPHPEVGFLGLLRADESDRYSLWVSCCFRADKIKNNSSELCQLLGVDVCGYYRYDWQEMKLETWLTQMAHSDEFNWNTDLDSALRENPEHAGNLAVCLDSSNFNVRLDKDIGLVIFRIITELLVNTFKRAGK